MVLPMIYCRKTPMDWDLTFTLSTNTQSNMIVRTWAIDDTQDIIAIWWDTEQELTRLIARSPKFPPIYTGFNQWNTERFWYSCVITSWLRAWFSIWWMEFDRDFTTLMYELCNEMEDKWLWNPKAGGWVEQIGNAFVSYMNKRFPDKKVWKTKIKYGSSAFGGALKRNIPIVTAYIHSQQYWAAKSDGEIDWHESAIMKYGTMWHCITISWMSPIPWAWLNFQDNYEWTKWNQYRVFLFRRLMEATWFKDCFYILLPEDMKPVLVNDRATITK